MDGRTEILPILQKRAPNTPKLTRFASVYTQPDAKKHHMVSGILAPLYTVYGLKLGCSGAVAPIGDEVL